MLEKAGLARYGHGMTIGLIAYLDTVSKGRVAILSIVLVFVVGVFDYRSGNDVSLGTVYLAPVALSAWVLGRRFAIFVSLLSVAVWAIGGLLSGDEDFRLDALDLWWNGTCQLIAYLALLWALTALHELQRDLEQRIEVRAALLVVEIAERERLQRELLEVSEREQRRIGQDLHDGLCQHLAGTAMASQVLCEKLAARDMAEAADARIVVDLVERGIKLSREIARGLHPFDGGSHGLMDSLREFADTSSELYRVKLRFECASPVLNHDMDTTVHLYRIAQEAVANALKHGKARHIVIRLDTNDKGCSLSIQDDGSGITPGARSERGMGLRIMRYRSKVIGGTMEVRALAHGGTVAVCTFPAARRQLASVHG